METLEQPAVEESLLIFSNDTEINKIVEDARIRANFLNEIISSGVTVNQIKDLSSEKAIENFLFQENLKLNKFMAQQYSAGMKQRALVEAFTLPDNLEHMQRQLLQWLNYPIHRGGDKYQFLKFNQGKFELEFEALEREFIMRKLKVYIQGADVLEWKQLESFCEHFKAHKIEVGQIRCNYFDSCLQPIGRAEYVPRWTYFNRDRH